MLLQVPCKAKVSNLFVTRDLFCRRQFFFCEMGVGMLLGDSNTLHLWCILLLFLLHQLHLRSPGIKFQRLVTLYVKDNLYSLLPCVQLLSTYI